MFGQPIPLNFHGNDTYKTTPGGVMSMCFLVMFAGYFFLKLTNMKDHKDWALVQQNVLLTSNELAEAIPFSDQDKDKIKVALQFNQRRKPLSPEDEEREAKRKEKCENKKKAQGRKLQRGGSPPPGG